MQAQLNLLASAVLSALAVMSTTVSAQTVQTAPPQQSQQLQEVVVTASPFATEENAQILTPAKVLAGKSRFPRPGKPARQRHPG